MTSELRIQVDSTADTKGIDRTADALDDLADQADQTKKSTKGLGDEVDKTTTKTEGLGRKSRKTSEDVRTLDGRIVQLKSDLKALGAELERDSGNKNLLAKFRSDSNELKGLQRTRKEISGLTDDVKDLGKAGGAAASTFTSLFQGGAINFLKTPFGATSAGVLGAGLAINAGALAGGAISGGVGAGVAGAGIAGAAMQSKAVQDEWAKTTANIKNQFLDATTSFEQPTIAAIRRMDNAFREIDMEKIFGNAEKFVEPLSAAAAKAVGSIGRGVEALVSEGEPAVRAIGDLIEDVAGGAEKAMETIAGGSEGGAAAIRDLGSALSEVVQDTGYFVRGMEEAYDKIDDLRRLSKAHPFIGFMYDNVKHADDVHVLADTTLGLAIAAGTAADSYYTLDQRMSMAAQRARDQVAAFGELEQVFEDAKGKILELSDANIDAAENVAQLKKSFEDNGKTIDINTEKGRENLRSINDTIEGYIRQRDAAIAAGGGTEEAYNRARAAYNSQIASLEVLVGKLLGSKQAAADFMAQFYDKTVNITVKVHQVGDVTREGVILSGDMRTRVGQAYASGTPSAKHGWALVGEKGPELVEFGGGERVRTAPETATMLRGAGTSAPVGGSGTMNVTVRLVVAPGADSALGSLLMKMAQTGDLGFVLAN